MNRREFLQNMAITSGVVAMSGSLLARAGLAAPFPEQFDLLQWERERVLRNANTWMNAAPASVTDKHSVRSAGGPHDYFSEGDYWWPDPKNPDAPYIQRDGMSNPQNFNDHRLALIRLSRIVAALTAAYKETGDEKYAARAVKHLQVWFLDEKTRMTPNLLYAQAIHGRFTGRGTGIIDTIHLAEVVQAIPVLQQSKSLSDANLQDLKQWFSDYLTWISTHRYGKTERAAQNNHATCWVMQAAAFARFVGEEAMLTSCRQQLKDTIIEDQIAADGSFPRELSRTKPYSYSLFNLDNMGIAAHILSLPGDNSLWTTQNAKGGSLKKALEWHYPFIADKSKWPYKPDVMFFEFFPVRIPTLLFASIALQEPRYLELWKKLNPDPTNEEVIRNFPVRQPVLWVNT